MNIVISPLGFIGIGVAATIIVEFVAIIVYTIYYNRKR